MQGMKYIYFMGVQHCDLKAANCLLDQNGLLKIADFGISKNEELQTHTATQTKGGGMAGTITHMSPEALDVDDEEGFTEKSDVYALAMTLYEIVSGDFPWSGKTPAQILTQVLVKKQRPPIPEGTPAWLGEIMVDCWAHDPKKRPTFAEVLQRLPPPPQKTLRSSFSSPVTPPHPPASSCSPG